MSSPTNPYNAAAGAEERVIITPMMTQPEGHEASTVLGDLDAFGSTPVTGDAAAQRPLNPPSIGADSGGSE